jgi:hypothetical protein
MCSGTRELVVVLHAGGSVIRMGGVHHARADQFKERDVIEERKLDGRKKG